MVQSVPATDATSTPVTSALERVHAACLTHLRDPRLHRGESWSKFLALEADVGLWLVALAERPETTQYRSAHRDLGLAFYAVSSGLYRQAFSSLRAFMEVAFATIRFSAAELERRQWVNGRRDLSWAEVTSVESGLYAAGYLREFAPEAGGEGEAMMRDLKVAYRRCSEYLHGNVPTTSLLPDSIVYAHAVVDEWGAVATSTLRVLHHSLFVRYYAEMTEGAQSMIEPCLEQHLGQLKSVRMALGLPVEES